MISAIGLHVPLDMNTLVAAILPIIYNITAGRLSDHCANDAAEDPCGS